jgi:hypothetical protein
MTHIFYQTLDPALSAVSRPSSTPVSWTDHRASIDHRYEVIRSTPDFGLNQRDSCPGTDGPAQAFTRLVE